MPLYLFAFCGNIARDRRGVSALEYAVLALGIISAVAVGAATVGHALTAAYGTIAGSL